MADLSEKETRKQIIEIAEELSEWFTPKAIKQLKKDLKNHDLLVEKDDSVLGFLFYEIKNKKCFIKFIAVKRDKQEKGIGKKLIKRLVDICRKKQIKEIEADTLAQTEDYKPYEKTRNFYHALGFKDIKIIKKGYSDGDDKLILRRDIIGNNKD